MQSDTCVFKVPVEYNETQGQYSRLMFFELTSLIFFPSTTIKVKRDFFNSLRVFLPWAILRFRSQLFTLAVSKLEPSWCLVLGGTLNPGKKSFLKTHVHSILALILAYRITDQQGAWKRLHTSLCCHHHHHHPKQTLLASVDAY